MQVAHFFCKALYVGFQCSAYWIIDGVQRGAINEHGMRSHIDHSNNNEYTSTLTVNASEAMNNTSIKCRCENLSEAGVISLTGIQYFMPRRN